MHKFIRKRSYWAFLPVLVLLRVALPVDANATTDWLVPWEDDEPTEEVVLPEGDYDSGWATELAKTACYAMKEGKSFTASIIFATASHAVDYNDQLTINDNADMEILSLEIGNAIQAQCRETAVKAFDQESIPVSDQL